MGSHFYTGMHAAERTGSEAKSLIAGAGHGGAPRRTRRPVRARRDEQRGARLAIVFSFFLVLVILALLVGGHFAIDPLLQSAAAAREARRVGDIVYAMPGGGYCRHLAFDNVTAEISERTVESCAKNPAAAPAPAANGFAWGTR